MGCASSKEDVYEPNNTKGAVAVLVPVQPASQQAGVALAPSSSARHGSASSAAPRVGSGRQLSGVSSSGAPRVPSSIKSPSLTRAAAEQQQRSGGPNEPQHAMARTSGTTLRRNSTDRASNASEQSMILGSTKHSSHRLSPELLVARANSRASSQYKKNSVGADLHSIMDDQGMLNPLVARQMSVLSHYSVRSESGSVLITPVLKSKSEFQLIKLIGRGGFGNVYLGEWRDGERIAVKIIQGYNHTEQGEEQEWEARKERMAQMEAVLMSAIAHDNIVRTLKVIAHQGEQVEPELAAVEKQLLKAHVPANSKEPDEGPPSFEWHIIMEYCDRGSLSRALSAFMLHEPVDSSSVKWDAWASLQILMEVTRSLQFLHDNRILHGDLKAANVLLTSNNHDRRNYIAKVSDFGLSRVLQNNKNHIKTQTFGTVTHVPPELLAKGTLSPKADVYAIGILMWEIFTAEKVFKQLSDSEVILAVVTKKARPTFPVDVPPRFKFLAERCWSEMTELRPSLKVVMSELESLQHKLCPDGPSSAPLTVKVYPSRQKALAESLQKQQQRQQAKEAHQQQQQLLMQLQVAGVSTGGTGSSSRSGSVGPSSPARAAGPPGMSRLAPSLSAVGSTSSRTPVSSQFRDSDRPCGGGAQVEASPGSYSISSQPNPQNLPIPVARAGSSTGGAYIAPRLNSNSSTGGGGGYPSPLSNHNHSHHGPSSPLGQTGHKLRSSAGRTLSPLAPQHAGSPERVNHDLSVQRPAEPRASQDTLPFPQPPPRSASIKEAAAPASVIQVHPFQSRESIEIPRPQAPASPQAPLQAGDRTLSSVASSKSVSFAASQL